MRSSERTSARVPPTAARTTALGLAAALASSQAASAMEFRTTGNPAERLVIHATGTIQRGDAERFRAVLAGAGNQTPHLHITSGGGLVSDAVQIATIVNQVRIPVTAGDVCASACFFVFAASPFPTIGLSTQVGVHRAYHRVLGETEASKDVTWDLARIAQSLSVPSAVVERIMTTPGAKNSVYWLTENDYRAMRVRYALPVPAQHSASIVAAVATPSPVTGHGGMAEAGRNDRSFYRDWFAGLPDSGRRGALFSGRPRRLSGPASCLSINWTFTAACYKAHRFWEAVDEKGQNPDYRRGWEGP